MERLFQILAVILAGAAAFLFWYGLRDFTFAAIVLGCVAFFLSVRVQVKARLNEREALRTEAEESEEG